MFRLGHRQVTPTDCAIAPSQAIIGVGPNDLHAIAADDGRDASMTGKPTDGQTDRLIRARWREIGLSQADLATLLDAAFQPPATDGDRPAGPDAGRLAQVAAALGMPAHFGRDNLAAGSREKLAPSSAEGLGPQQSLLELRLLRAFSELRDPRARCMLVYLAEQLAKCTGPRPGDES
jgi:hypothetical protein